MHPSGSLRRDGRTKFISTRSIIMTHLRRAIRSHQPSILLNHQPMPRFDIPSYLRLSFSSECMRHFGGYPLELPLPTTAQQLEAGDGSDGCSPTDVNPPAYARDEGGNTLALAPPAVTKSKYGFKSGRPHLQSSAHALIAF
jgi:hypothetical protein